MRSYIGPGTLARVLAALADHRAPLPAILNIAAPQPVAMTDLAEAAGVPWIFAAAPPHAVQRLTLDCAALGARVPLAPGDSDPATIVAQWRAQRVPA